MTTKCDVCHDPIWVRPIEWAGKTLCSRCAPPKVVTWGHIDYVVGGTQEWHVHVAVRTIGNPTTGFFEGFYTLVEDYAFDTEEAAAAKVRELLRDPEYRLAFGQVMPES